MVAKSWIDAVMQTLARRICQAEVPTDIYIYIYGLNMFYTINNLMLGFFNMENSSVSMFLYQRFNISIGYL